MVGPFFRGCLIAASLALPDVAQADSWLCIADQSTGFSYDKDSKQWSVARFKVADDRYMIGQQKVEGYPYTVKKFGSNDPMFMLCKGGLVVETFLSCSGFGGAFKFNVKTLRFYYSYDIGYVNPTPGVNDMKEGDDTPFIEIGRCSLL